MKAVVVDPTSSLGELSLGETFLVVVWGIYGFFVERVEGGVVVEVEMFLKEREINILLT